MEKEDFVISRSKLEEAHETSDRAWLASTFSRARQVIETGGRVRITQVLSGNTIELVAIIDNLEGLGYYCKRYGV